MGEIISMAIDDNPVAIVRRSLCSEHSRNEFASAELFLKALKCLPLARSAIESSGVDVLIEHLASRERDNLELLVNVLADEVQRLEPQVRELITKSDEHRLFVMQDLPHLILDAMERVRRVRARDRIRRIACILAHSVGVVPVADADYIEEFLRTAVEIGDRDVLVLRTAIESEPTQVGNLTGQGPRFTRADVAWRAVREKLARQPDDLESIGSKLQSFGLVGPSKANSVGMIKFVVLQKGRDFLAHVAGSAAADQ
jgi:hypothetical protein